MFNIGVGNFTKSSVLRLTNAGDFKKAGESFLMWNKAGGKVVAGLTKRRDAEKGIFLRGVV
jgi:GH24 family phage-related lysozyme (muramidase)